MCSNNRQYLVTFNPNVRGLFADADHSNISVNTWRHIKGAKSRQFPP